jgi:hypothetical protein
MVASPQLLEVDLEKDGDASTALKIATFLSSQRTNKPQPQLQTQPQPQPQPQPPQSQPQTYVQEDEFGGGQRTQRNLFMDQHDRSFDHCKQLRENWYHSQAYGARF